MMAAASLISTLAVCIAASQSAAAPNRPLRTRQTLILTVGQTEGDLQGRDDKIIQAGVEYLNRLGGGTLRLLPGTYTLQNAIYLRPNITLQGSGETTILRKAASVATALTQDSDWFEYGVQVKDAKGFMPGGGIMLGCRIKPRDDQFQVLRATITAVQGNTLLLDRLIQTDSWTDRDAMAATVFPLLTGETVTDVVVQNLVLDGNRDQNEYVNGNFTGAVFIQQCHRWRLENVVARDYNGDGFSFQAFDDILLQNCRALNNADLGFHPGSGSQRPVLRDCTAQGNRVGLYFCWSVCDGRVENCSFSENHTYGISIGYRDTDNLIQGCTLERNGEVGILFRNECTESRGGHRNRIEDCLIRDSGTEKPGIGIDIQGRTRDITIRNTRFQNTAGGRQTIGIRVGREAHRIALEDNTFDGCRTSVEDLRPYQVGP
jgi:polygalacturonase